MRLLGCRMRERIAEASATGMRELACLDSKDLDTAAGQQHSLEDNHIGTKCFHFLDQRPYQNHDDGSDRIVLQKDSCGNHEPALE